MYKSVTLIKDRMKMGITQPFICECDDNKSYVVKTLQIMPLKQIIAEFIGSYICQKIGLPCPNIELIKIEQHSIDFISPEWSNNLNIGIAFGSEFIQDARIAKSIQAREYLSEPQQKELYMLDRWINNTDRSSSQIGGTGNLNLLYSENEQSIFVIDHNLAFDMKDEEEFDSHIFAPNNRIWEIDWIDKENFKEKALDILKDFDHICELIPDEWIPFDDEEYQKFENILSEIKNTLNRINNKDYWDNIK